MRAVSRRAALVAGALVLVAAAAGGATASAPQGHGGGGGKDEASLVGAAKMFREDGQRVRFTFDAHGFGWNKLPQGTSRGTFRFSHYTADGEQGVFAEGRIDCLETGGPVATATGIITRSDLKGAKGKRVGFTVYDDGRHDRLGYSWGGGNGDLRKMKVEPCLSAAPYETVEKGDFTVHHKMPSAPSPS